MKATKNQANSVRDYLATIGHDITHVQALEVIARGQGLRSRHAFAAPTGVNSKVLPGAVPSNGMGLSKVIEVAGEIVRIGKMMNILPSDMQVDMGYVDAIERLHEQLSGEIQKNRIEPLEKNRCEKCDTVLVQGYCGDDTCPFADWPQDVLHCDICEFPTAKVEEMYGIKKRARIEEPALVSPCEMLQRKYGKDDEHPDYPRGDWLFQSATQRTIQAYWDWVATRLESIDSDELDVYARATEIRAIYQKSGCWPSDLPGALLQLKDECSDMFSDENEAQSFLEDEDQSVHAFCEIVSLANAIKSRYREIGRTPQALRTALRDLKLHCSAIYKEVESAHIFLTTETSKAATVSPLAPAEIAVAIKGEYLASKRESADVDFAVSRLMLEARGLFAHSNAAWEFINEEQHEDTVFDFVIQVEVNGGNEVLTYGSAEKREVALIVLMENAIKLNDGYPRDLYISEIERDIEKDSAAYDFALELRELVGEIRENGEVYFRGQLIGTIDAIGESFFTLPAWLSLTLRDN